MTGSLLQAIRQIVAEELGRVRPPQLAVVQETHPHASESDTDNYACTVRLRDSDTVLKRVPVATGRIGLASIPAPGNLVLVQFLGGDARAPIITGSFYNDEDRPPANADGQVVLHLPVDAADADAVRVQLSTGDTREILLRLGAALTLELKDDDPVIRIDVADGAALVEIARDGSIAISKSPNISLEAGEITIEASGTLNLKGATVNIN